MKSRSKNRVLQDIEEGITEHRYKNCIHLSMVDPGPYSDDYYFTGCAKDAFDRPDTAHQMLTSPDAVTCPQNCRLFEDRVKAERAEKWKKFFSNVRYRRGRIWEGFMRFHWAERMVIWASIFLFLLWLIAPNLIPQALEIIGNLVD